MVCRAEPTDVSGLVPGLDQLVDVIVPSINTRELLRATLRSLLAQEGMRSEQVIVVDMSSTDGTLEMLACEFPSVRVLRETPNRGYGAAVNAGIRTTTAPWVLACNSDLQFAEPGALGKLLRYAVAEQEAGILGVQLVNTDGTLAQSAFRLPGRLSLAATFCAPLRYFPRMNSAALGYLDLGSCGGPTAVGWVSGAVLLLRRSALDETGLFDESFFMNSEEVDLCRRMHDIGRQVLCVRDVHVVHVGGGSTSATGRGLTLLVEGQARYTRKYFGSAWLKIAVILSWLALACSYPVWWGRRLLRRSSGDEVAAERLGFARALMAAGRV